VSGAASAGSALRPDGEGGFRYQDSKFSARIARDGTVELRDEPNVDFEGLKHGQASFSFDLNDLLAHARGEDPYQYDKQKFLHDTRELRDGLCEQDLKDRLKRSVWDLKRDLSALWANGGLSVKERRSRLFELWDSCAEEGDPEIQRASAMARATILGFIRERIPLGHPDGFSRTELLALNQRRHSRASFEPYAAGPLPE
jgi:hypothetical protein